ncbi:MAG: response regulator transcription factor [Spirochaetales bacterium]|nr:response regulator transcription factor [Spirochaetales bacterium]
MAQGTVLIVDDDKQIRELITFNLSREGYRSLTAKSGEEAILLVEKHRPDLIVLDLMLPGIDGLTVCRKVKENAVTSQIPVLMLTAKSEDSDVVLGLEMGADDYLTKPFSPRVLLARIKSLFRRIKAEPAEEEQENKKIIIIHGLIIDPVRFLVELDKYEIKLSATEFAILYLLASHPDQVFPREQIIDRIKGKEYFVTARSVDVQILNIRRKLGSYSGCIETVRGVGYRLRESLLEK